MQKFDNNSYALKLCYKFPKKTTRIQEEIDFLKLTTQFRQIKEVSYN